MTRKFLRTDAGKYKKLGRKKKLKWRKARGRHNKTREKRKSRQRKVEIGFRGEKEKRGKINGKIPVYIKNLKEAGNIQKGQTIIIRKVGKKKKLAIEKIIKERMGELR